MAKPTLAARTLKFAHQRGVIRARDLAEQAIPAVILSRLVESGQLTRLSRGLYSLPTRTPSQQHQLAEVAARSPTAVFCLLTALRFHGITTQNPHELWIALPNKSRAPRIEYPPLRTVRYYATC